MVILTYWIRTGVNVVGLFDMKKFTIEGFDVGWTVALILGICAIDNYFTHYFNV